MITFFIMAMLLQNVASINDIQWIVIPLCMICDGVWFKAILSTK